MAFINVEIRHNNVDISNIVISYNRTHDLCTSIGTIDLVLVTTARQIDPWDTIIIYEEGTKKATFFVSEVSKDANSGTTSVRGQDGSKKLTDYFIAESYTVDYYSLTGTWIEQFLTEAGISYSMTGGGGVALSENTSLGLSSAYDQIMTLLQYSNWYMYFNEDNTAIIGELTLHSGNPTAIDDSRILSTKVTINDQMLRNRAVVWGNYDIYGQEQVFADLSVITPWNYDANDLRAVVISNSNIRSTTDANNLARQMLTEFARITSEKTIELEGALNVFPSDMVFVRSHGYRGSGMITTLSVEMSAKGLITTLILDQRCPRLFAFFGIYDDYVYVGTSGEGVWRKPLGNSAWEEYNIGIPSGDWYITDLYVNDYILATTTASGTLYHKEFDGSWIPFIPSGLIDITSGLDYSLQATAVACTINHLDNTIIAAYHTPSGIVGGEYRGWVVQVNPSGSQDQVDQIYSASGEYNIRVLDLDTNDKENIITVAGLDTLTSVVNLGIRSNSLPLEQSDSVIILPESNEIPVTYEEDYVIGSYTVTGTGWAYPLVQAISSSRTYAYFVSLTDSGSPNKHTATRVKYEPVWTGTEWEVQTSATTVINITKSLSTGGLYDTGRFFYKTDEDDDILYATAIQHDFSGTHKLIFNYFVINFQTGTYTLDSSQEFNLDGVMQPIGGSVSYNDFNLQQKDNYIWQVFTSISGNVLTIKYFYFDQLSGILYTGTAGSYTASGKTAISEMSTFGYYRTGSFAPQKNGVDFIFALPYSADNDIIGMIYGNKTSVTGNVLWTRPHAGLLTTDESISNFIGDTYVDTNLVVGVNIKLNGTTASNYKGWGCVSHFNNFLNNTNNIYTIVGTEEQVDAWLASDNEDLLHRAGIQTGDLEWCFPVSSKYLQTPYYIQKWYTDMEADPPITGIRVVSMPTNTEVSRFTLETDGYVSVSPTYFGNQNYDDFSAILYLNAEEPFGTENLVTTDFYGNLIHSYDQIGTDAGNFGYTANGFIIRHSKSAYFMWPVDGYHYGTSGGTGVIKQTDHVFETIYQPVGTYYVEISKQYPTEIYHISASGEFLPIYQTFTNLINDFDLISTTYPIYDGRVFDVAVPSGFVVESGSVESNNWRYFGIVDGESLRAFPVTLSGNPITIATFSGFVNNLETSNNSTNPYFFVSASGVPPIFYQRDPEGITFIDYSSGLPSAEITIIRLDDRL